ncbi:FecR domain-containing protein [Pantoea sp. 18069]|uniref:FecR domain-containing protein n=1 Tax=Pantoea sp. 18069 TaxID=2681415 RepID=UPI0013598608|nr:FecR domain-containing protein [Pantoea sp. 18069]
MSSADAARADATIDPAILREAAEWLTQLHGGDAGPKEWEAIECWRASSPAHGRAWQRAEALMGDLRDLPGGPLRATLEKPAARRRHLLRLLWLPLLPTAGWLGWQQRRVDGERWRSATGEQLPLTLADGTRLLLNTATEIAVDFNAQARTIGLLGGEILVTSAPDPSPLPRPLRVVTADGSVRPIGTRFSVRRAGSDDYSRVVVFEGAVEVEGQGKLTRVDAGQRLDFGASGAGQPQAHAGVADEAWTQGMVVARRMRLADLVAELDRYHPGFLRCHPDVADLRISGTFPALARERSLQLLAETLPVQVRQRSAYWVTVEPAHAAQ